MQSNTRPLALGGSILLGVLLAACTPKDPMGETSAALVDGTLLPAYRQWQSADSQLAASAQSFCAGQQDLDGARQAFRDAQAAWSRLQPMLVGPLGEGNLAWQVQFWPDKKNLVARQVSNLLKRHPQLTREDVEKASVVVQGLTAYEYLLFDPQLDLAEGAQRTRYCPLLTAIGAHQSALADDILAQWQAEDGMAAQLRQFPNLRYAEPSEAIGDLLRVQVSALDGLKKKLGLPLGRPGQGIPQPYQAEAWRSQGSLASIAASLEGAERLWQGQNGNGLRGLLDDSQQALAERIDASYEQLNQQLQAMPPLAEQLATAEGQARLNELYDRLDALHRLHQGELARALGVQIGFNAHDGD